MKTTFKKATALMKKFGQQLKKVKSAISENDVEKTVSVHIVPVNKFASQDTITKGVDEILEIGKPVAYFCARKHIERTEASDVFRCSDYGLSILKCRFGRRDYRLEVGKI